MAVCKVSPCASIIKDIINKGVSKGKNTFAAIQMETPLINSYIQTIKQELSEASEDSLDEKQKKQKHYLQGLFNKLGNVNSLTTDEYIIVAKKIAEEHRRAQERERNAMDENRRKFYNSWVTLNQKYTPQVLRDRTNLVIDLMQRRITLLQEKFGSQVEGGQVSRVMAIMGFRTTDGTDHGGLSYIENIIRRIIDKRIQKLEEAKLTDTDVYKEYKKMQSYIDDILVMAEYKLQYLEGIKINPNSKAISQLTENDLDIDPEIVEYVGDKETQTQEHWQRKIGEVSNFRSITTRVRRLLGRIPLNNYVQIPTDRGDHWIPDPNNFDTFGNPRYRNPVECFNTLMKELQYMTDEEDMIEILKKSDTRWITEFVVPMLEGNDIEDIGFREEGKEKVIRKKTTEGNKNYQYTLRTDFYQCFNKTKINYGIVEQGDYGVVTASLNNDRYGRYTRWSEYKASVFLNHEQVPGVDMVYNSDGTINWANMIKAIKAIHDILEETSNGGIGDNTIWIREKANRDRTKTTKVLLDVLRAFGMNVSDNDIRTMLDNNADAVYDALWTSNNKLLTKDDYEKNGKNAIQKAEEHLQKLQNQMSVTLAGIESAQKEVTDLKRKYATFILLEEVEEKLKTATGDEKKELKAEKERLNASLKTKTPFQVLYDFLFNPKYDFKPAMEELKKSGDVNIALDKVSDDKEKDELSKSLNMKFEDLMTAEISKQHMEDAMSFMLGQLAKYIPTKEELSMSIRNSKGKNTRRYNNTEKCALSQQLDLINAYINKKDRNGLAKLLYDNYMRNRTICVQSDELATWISQNSDTWNKVAEIGNPYYIFTQINQSGKWKSANNNLIEEVKQAIGENNLNKLIKLFKDGDAFFITNPWIDNLFIQCTNMTQELALIYDEHSDLMWHLGRDYKEFSDHNAVEHMQACMAYWAYPDKKRNGRITDSGFWAYYPIFITGDSGVQKFVRMKKVSVSECFHELYLMYLGEEEKFPYAKKINDYCGEQMCVADDYTRLPWLSKHYEVKDATGQYGKYWKQLQDKKIEKYNKNKNDDAKIISVEDERLRDVVLDSKEFEALFFSENSEFRKDTEAKFFDNLEKMGLLEIADYNDTKTGDLVYKYYTKLRTVFSENMSLNKLEKKQDGTWQMKQGLKNELIKFLWNYKINMSAQLQFTVVDPGFFFNPDGSLDIDKLQKRYKGEHSPGTPLSLYAKDENGIYYANDGQGGVINHQNVVYIADEIVNNGKSYDEFMEVIKDVFGEGSKIYDTYKKGSTSTDGQGWRTLKSMRKVLGMSAKWTHEHELAYNKIQQLTQEWEKIRDDSNKKDEIAKLKKEAREVAAIFMPIKPIIRTTERRDIEDDVQGMPTRMEVPVFIKYSEMPVIPILMNEDSPLAAMAEWMEKNDIDMICSKSCVKIGAYRCAQLGLRMSEEDRKKIDPINYKDPKVTMLAALNKSKEKGWGVHELLWEDMYMQSALTAHEDTERMVSTQFRKLLFHNLSDNETYEYVGKGVATVNIQGKEVKLNGDGLKQFYNALVSSGLIESFNKLKAQLTTKDGKISYKELSNFIHTTLASTGRASMEFIVQTMLDSENKFEVPVFDQTTEHDVLALLLSMYRNGVIKQQMAGGMYVQASDMGINSVAEDSDLGFIYDEYTDKNGKKHKNIKAIECEVPFDLTWKDAQGKEHALTEEDYNKYCNEDGTLKTDDQGNTLIEKDYAGCLDMVAVRVPCEREYSMLRLRIKRFSPKAAGQTIKVPAMCTIIAGFDFDIDKLYFMRHEFQDDGTEENARHWIEYDPNEDIFNQDRVARNNVFLQLAIARLEDPRTLKARLDPASFDMVTEAGQMMQRIETQSVDKLNQKSFNQITNEKTATATRDFTDPSVLIDLNQRVQVNQQLIGIFANQNAHKAMCSMLKTLKMQKEIQMFGQTYGDFLDKSRAETVDKTCAQLLDAAVDTNNWPWLSYNGINRQTGSVAIFLARLGLTVRQIGLFLNQPIIRKIVEIADRKGKRMEYAYEDILNELSIDINKLNADAIRDMSEEEMYNAIINAKQEGYKLEEDDIQKNSILPLFMNILGSASQMSRFVNISRYTATGSWGSTLGAIYAQQFNVDIFNDMLNEQYDNATRKNFLIIEASDNTKIPVVSFTEENNPAMDFSNPFAYECLLYQLNAAFNQEILKDLFPYESGWIVESRKQLADIAEEAALTEDDINSIHRDAIAYIMAKKVPYFNGGVQIKDPITDKRMSQRDYFLYYFPQHLSEFLKKYSNLKLYYPILAAINPALVTKSARELQDTGLGMTEKGAKEKQKELRGDKNAERAAAAASFQQGQQEGTFSQAVAKDPKERAERLVLSIIHDTQNAYFKEELMQSWMSLANIASIKDGHKNFLAFVKDKAIKEDVTENEIEFFKRLPIDLYMYGFFEQGFNFGRHSFIQYCPAQVKKMYQLPTYDGTYKTLAEIEYNILDGNDSESIANEFVAQYIANHLDNTKLVKNVYNAKTIQMIMQAIGYKYDRVKDSQGNAIGKAWIQDASSHTQTSEDEFVLSSQVLIEQRKQGNSLADKVLKDIMRPLVKRDQNKQYKAHRFIRVNGVVYRAYYAQNAYMKSGQVYDGEAMSLKDIVENISWRKITKLGTSGTSTQYNPTEIQGENQGEMNLIEAPKPVDNNNSDNQILQEEKKKNEDNPQGFC